eukprot:2316834-Rhodomonas_salina.3
MRRMDVARYHSWNAIRVGGLEKSRVQTSGTFWRSSVSTIASRMLKRIRDATCDLLAGATLLVAPDAASVLGVA